MKIVYFYSSPQDKRRKQKKLMKIILKIIAITISIAITHGAIPVYAIDTSGAERIGYEIWKIVRIIALFVLAGFTVRDVIRDANDSTLKDILGIVLKYSTAWIVVAFIIKFFLWIEKIGN